MSVVTNSTFCPMCACDPCECEWSDDDSFEEGAVDIVQVSAAQCDGDDRACPVPTIGDLGSSIFDCLSSFSGDLRNSEDRQCHSNVIGELPSLQIGDLVKWYPVHTFMNPKSVWVIKKILNPTLMDSGWFDYEITNGIQNHYVTKYELFKLTVPNDD